jgi:WD40-like Beta Propeller Repeat
MCPESNVRGPVRDVSESSARKLRPWLAAGVTVVVLGGVIAYWATRADPGDPRLASFVHARPPVPVVFTSRSEPASLIAAAPEGEGFRYPGQRLWAAREGRLRLLTPAGTVHELTWGKSLPDGGTLIDVMSPSVSPDGKRILFAGRKSADDRFRLYEIGVDGRGLRALTGGPNDEGCTAVPPMRWRADGNLIPDAERRAADYDDVDPIELDLSDRRIVFVSSRMPDLGRDHARRSTTLWVLHADGRTVQASANRNNDRWPFLMTSGYIAFSLWSRNREVISADLAHLRPFEPTDSATRPTDIWLGAFTQMPGGHFGMLVKPPVPVWRPRPLFANRIAFMTTFAEPGSYGDQPPFTVVQSPPGVLANVPSARPPDRPPPHARGVAVRRGPDRDTDGRPLWLATPSPSPPSHVLLAGAPVVGNTTTPEPGAYGLYLANDDWPEGDQPASAATIDLKLLFDDPEFVDAEPVAVYDRKLPPREPPKEGASGGTPPADLPLLTGQVYRGPMAQVFATALDTPTRMGDLPGQWTDTGAGPIFDASPPGAINHLRIYAARRDRFDDPVTPRITGDWELILKVPVKGGVAATWMPTDTPTVLAGYDKAGHVVQWSTAAKDAAGRSASFYAYAGDHYSLAQPGGRHFCVGCHPGHSGIPASSHNHAERP